jgi:hypothetical protein
MKYFALLLISLCLFSGCNKESPAVPDPATAEDISPVPNRFDQKMLVEAFTMTTCGQCPKSHLLMDSLLTQYSGRAYGVYYHVADLLEDTNLLDPYTGTNTFDSIFNPNSIFPSGLVNRRVNNSLSNITDYWFSNTQSLFGRIPSCGLAIEAKDLVNGILTVTVHTGFSADMAGAYRLNGLLVQNVFQTSDSTYDQMNDFSSEGFSPDSTISLYQLNDTIRNYQHKYVVRRILSANGLDGDEIPQGLMFRGNDYVKNYSVSVVGLNTENYFLIFYVDKFGPPDGHLIENVQRCPIGESKDWN